MALIAREAGLGNRTAAQKVVRRLEAKGIISPTTSKKGGRKNPTRYQFNLGNSIPTDALSATTNSIPRDANCRETASLETGNSIPTDARDSSKTEKQQQTESESAAAAVSQEQMETELMEVWNYYLDAFKREEIISPSARRTGIAILTGLRERYPKVTSEICVAGMKSAIDRALRITKTRPKKEYFSSWFTIFSKFETFFSLWEEAD
jgi:ribosomal protein S25